MIKCTICATIKFPTRFCFQHVLAGHLHKMFIFWSFPQIHIKNMIIQFYSTHIHHSKWYNTPSLSKGLFINVSMVCFYVWLFFFSRKGSGLGTCWCILYKTFTIWSDISSFIWKVKYSFFSQRIVYQSLYGGPLMSSIFSSRKSPVLCTTHMYSDSSVSCSTKSKNLFREWSKRNTFS